ncbi:MAG: single-stranded DNA-binding protein [Deltaproteobacteria bacterium]|nr:MAG: single-stranded DNA-binding protein [Deltaproteobacteria bacterium]RUA02650.1 MAG: single-stranded DNA-binding protein [Deltaproteobacteria bacterium]
MTLQAITDQLLTDLKPLCFGPPVTHVYSPLTYARKPYDQYLARFGGGPKEVVLVGMNPGPWGMSQTGIPFGNVQSVIDWLGIRAPVGTPDKMHPKRPVTGFDCPRREVSGTRVWDWAREISGTPERFFQRFFIANYCPLAFIEESGRNRTPNKLPLSERTPLLAACDQALLKTVECLSPRFVIGIGVFAEGRIKKVCQGSKRIVGRITHPSPANPRANRGWKAVIHSELEGIGIRL